MTHPESAQVPNQPQVDEVHHDVRALPENLDAVSIAATPQETERRQPRWRRRLGALLLSTGLIQGAISSGAVGGLTEHASAAVGAHTEVARGTSNSLESLDGDVQALLGNEQKLYERANVKVSDKPFKASESFINHKSQTELVKPVLDKFEAKFEAAVELSSGIKINIYSSKLDKKSEPRDIDYKALDVLMNKLIQAAANMDNNPAASQFGEIERLAKKGKVNLLWNLIVVSDETLCLEDNMLTGDLPPVVERENNPYYCVMGLNFAPRQVNTPVSNQVAVALDVGRTGANYDNELPDYYDNQDQRATSKLGPDQWMAITLAHEAGHALFALTGLSGTIKLDQEHEEITNPLESSLYDYFTNLPKKYAKYVTPMHVDTRSSSKPDK